MRRNVWMALAPRLRAACSCSMPISSSTGTTSRITSGSDTKTVAMIIPGVAKITWNPASSRPGPNHPLRPPYTSTSASPTTTGDTESGRSMSAERTRRPGNR